MQTSLGPLGLSLSLAGLFQRRGGHGPLTAMRATGAGFGQISELAPATGIAQTTRVVTPHFLEKFEEFAVTYALIRVRSTSVTGTVSDGAGGAGNILTVTGITSGALYEESSVGNAGLATGTVILSQLTGDKGGLGTYTISGSPVNISSSTFTGVDADELFRGNGGIQTWEVGVGAYTPGYTGLPARQRVTIGGLDSFSYDYSTWDKNVGYFETDRVPNPRGYSDQPLELWTRVTLPSSLAGLPVNKSANQNFTDYGWGNDRVTSGTSADPITATSIAAVTSTVGQVALCITPIAIKMWTEGRAATVIYIGDSRGSPTGLGVNEPAGYGGIMGDAKALHCAAERGLYYTARQHSVMISKPSDRARYLGRPNNWHLRRNIAAALGDNADKILVPAYGQNDQNTANGTYVAYSASAFLPIGTVIDASNRMYVVVTRGTGGGTAPTGTDLNNDIAFGTATIRYLGTETTANGKQGLFIAGQSQLINRYIKTAMPGAEICQELLGPYTTGSPFATAAGQSDGLGSGAGKIYAAAVEANPALTMADRTIRMTSMSGSRTVNGGPDDGSRTWATDPSGAVNFFACPDGIHNGNYGAELGKADWTKQAVTGSP